MILNISQINIDGNFNLACISLMLRNVSLSNSSRDLNPAFLLLLIFVKSSLEARTFSTK